MMTLDNKLTQRVTLMRGLLAANNLRFSIEKVLSITIVLVLIGIALPNYQYYMYKATKTEFYGRLSTIKHDAVIEYSLTGKWPSLSDSVESDPSYYSKQSNGNNLRIISATSDRGNFELTYEMPDQEKIYIEAYRLVQVDIREPTLYWVCGYSEVRNDEIVTATNTTTAPVEMLDHYCHQKRNSM